MRVSYYPSFAAAHCKGHGNKAGLKPTWVQPLVSTLKVVFPSSLTESGSCKPPMGTTSFLYLGIGQPFFWPFCQGFTLCSVAQGSRRRATLFTSSSQSFLSFVFIVFLILYIYHFIFVFYLFTFFFFFLSNSGRCHIILFHKSHIQVNNL